MLKRVLILATCLFIVACGGAKKKAPVYHQVSLLTTEGGYLDIGNGKARDGYWGYTYPIVINEHYQVASMKGCGGRVNGVYYETGTILADCVITASFAPIQYTVSVNSGLGGKVTPTSAEGAYGTSLKFAVAVEDGFKLVDISGCNGVLSGGNYWVTSLGGDCVITVVAAVDNAANAATLEGTVAEGAALANVAVTAKCNDGSGFLETVTTNAQGQFSGRVADNTLPCALSADNRYYSLATATGTTNITPLTSLVLALASQQTGAEWFAGENWAAVKPSIDVAESLLNAQLSVSGYQVPEGEFEPFNADFAVGDDWDQLLDQLTKAIAADGGVDDFQALIQLVVSGDLDQLPAVTP